MDEKTEAAIDKGLSTMDTAEVSEYLGNLVAEQIVKIRNRAEAETRKELADGIAKQFIATTGRKTYGGLTPEQSVMDALTWPAMADDGPFELIRYEIEQTGNVPMEFTAGIRFVLNLLADDEYEV
jgi:predicted transcriptional regulator